MSEMPLLRLRQLPRPGKSRWRRRGHAALPGPQDRVSDCGITMLALGMAEADSLGHSSGGNRDAGVGRSRRNALPRELSRSMTPSQDGLGKCCSRERATAVAAKKICSHHPPRLRHRAFVDRPSTTARCKYPRFGSSPPLHHSSYLDVQQDTDMSPQGDAPQDTQQRTRWGPSSITPRRRDYTENSNKDPMAQRATNAYPP